MSQRGGLKQMSGAAAFFKALAIAALMATGTLSAGARVEAACTIGKIAELPVTMAGTRPIVSAKINGVDSRFLADSGSFYSLLTQAGAAELRLKLKPVPLDLIVTGVGGNARIWITTVKTFTLAGFAIPNVDFLVGGSEPADDVVGVLGQNVLGIGDSEYDLADGVIRLMHPSGCAGRPLAYWAKSYSMLDINSTSPLAPHTAGIAFVNGVKVRVIFDTGAAESTLTLAAAARAGITPQSPGVVAAGFTGGIGRRTAETWIAPVSTFKIGGEEIRNTRLSIGAFSLTDADMLLGADFFLSHRVYVARSQRKLYFTYNGGPVFSLGPAAPAGVATVVPPPAAAPTLDAGAAPADAADLARKGVALAARGDYAGAIDSLTGAVAGAPTSAKYVYARGVAYLGAKKPFLAMTDFDKALALAPDYVPALVARAELRLAGHDTAGATADLDATAKAAAPQADVRLRLADLYLRAEAFAPAAAQYDLWIAAHPDDSRRAEALNGRCRVRALSGRDLDKALADCDAALKLDARNPTVFDSRGLVRVRLGNLDGAIADFDAALALQPKSAWSLYGRGVAETKKGMVSEGKADIAAATALRPLLPEEARRQGIGP